LNGGEVGENAAYPTLVDEEHITAAGFLFDDRLSLFFGTDEHYLTAVGNQLFYVLTGFIKELCGFFKVYNMNFVALGKDVPLHLGVPAACLVAEVRPGFQKFFNSSCIRQSSPPLN